MIRANNISRSYGNFAAVNNVSFHIKSGEIVGLLGHNGAGKTTIMKMLTGYIEPSAGSIVIDGKELSENANDIQRSIGYLPENLPIYPEMSVMDYLFYCTQVRNIPEQAQETAVVESIRKTQLASKALQAIATLSRGFKQRVGVAQALIHNPKILILDEPTNGLDPHQTHEMRKLIRGLAQQSTVIISTHIMQEVDALCDRVIILDNGELAVDQSLEELRRSDTIALQTSANLSAVNALLASFYVNNQLLDSAAAELVSDTNGVNQFHLPTGSNIDISALIAWICEKLIVEGHKIYAIHPMLRDLETVFRNIHLNKNHLGVVEREVNNAA
ncbi:ABC transporter ATP-binding protein [Teredinibacter haidensis]|uniref:ABC transporter ATP-binding protein n=1 Tax=Teredinibacter haidensis TaxID=2731755 RepID=UPI000948BBD1|nr:ABC transporter ATP-binding protein [Teredinibacter haidensis]